MYRLNEDNDGDKKRTQTLDFGENHLNLGNKSKALEG